VTHREQRRNFAQGDLSKGEEGLSSRNQLSPKEKRSKATAANEPSNKDNIG
jgi:hypothetical protein